MFFSKGELSKHFADFNPKQIFINIIFDKKYTKLYLDGFKVLKTAENVCKTQKKINHENIKYLQNNYIS